MPAGEPGLHEQKQRTCAGSVALTVTFKSKGCILYTGQQQQHARQLAKTYTVDRNSKLSLRTR